MMYVFELLLQDGLGQQVPAPGTFGCGNPIPKQHCSDEGAFVELMMAFLNCCSRKDWDIHRDPLGVALWQSHT
jgi:hypothetical protein